MIKLLQAVSFFANITRRNALLLFCKKSLSCGSYYVRLNCFQINYGAVVIAKENGTQAEVTEMKPSDVEVVYILFAKLLYPDWSSIAVFTISFVF